MNSVFIDGFFKWVDKIYIYIVESVIKKLEKAAQFLISDDINFKKQKMKQVSFFYRQQWEGISSRFSVFQVVIPFFIFKGHGSIVLWTFSEPQPIWNKN